MASKYTKISRSITEFREFLEEHKEAYDNAVKYIIPSEGWNIPFHKGKIYQMPLDLEGNLYEKIYPMLLDNNSATDEEIIFALRGCLEFFEQQKEIFNEILDLREKNEKLGRYLSSLEGILESLVSKAIYKIKEVLFLAEEDLPKNNGEIPPEFLIAIITATQEEFESVKSLGDGMQMIPTSGLDSQIYYEGYFTNASKKLKVIVGKAHHQGVASSSVLTTKIINRFNPAMVVMMGHAAGNQNLSALKLGDILIGEESIDYQQVTVIQKDKGDESLITEKDRKIVLSADRTLITCLQTYCTKENLKLLKEQINNAIFTEDIDVHIGKIATGSALVRSKDWFDNIIKENSNVIGMDMETFAVYYAAEHTTFKNKPLYISLKSVSDFGYHNTKFAEEHKASNVRVPYACSTSARLFYNFALEYLPLLS